MARHHEFVFFVGLIAHLSLGISSEDFELCESGDITSTEGGIIFNSSSLNLEEKNGGIVQCRRLIRVPEGRIQLIVNETNLQGKDDKFEVFDGGFYGKKLTSNGEKRQGTYQASGNIIGLVLSVRKTEINVFFSSLRGHFQQSPFKTTCVCGGFQNGIQRCVDLENERKCELLCEDGYEDLLDVSRNYSCDFLDGRWNNELKSRVIACPAAELPEIHAAFEFNLTGGCHVTKENYSLVFRKIFNAETTIISKGQCFAKNNNECVIDVNCYVKNNNSFVAVKILDKATINNSSVKQRMNNFNKLYNAYSKNISLEEIMLKITAVNNIGLNDTVAMGNLTYHVTRMCPNGTFLMKKPGIQDTLAMCAKCPQGSFYNASVFTCKKCTNGTSSSEGSCTSLQPNEAQYRGSCAIKCAPGKGLDSTGFCQWCPYHTYQNISEVTIPKCTACPNGTMTLYPGTIDDGRCYLPCEKGAFFNITSQRCQSCLLGTYQDKANHLAPMCKKCNNDKVTFYIGSKDLANCVPGCTMGYFYNPSVKNCTKCRVGTYQDKANQMKCLQCPNDTSTLEEGSRTLDCIATCPSGTYYDVQNKSCSACPHGTYMDQQGHLQVMCKTCDLGKTTYTKSAESDSLCLEECTIGKYFNSTSSSCRACARGSYQDQTGQVSCTLCPTGFSTEREGTFSKNNCIKFVCNQGEYIDPNTRNCHICTRGTYQSAVNHTLSSCQLCSSGVTSVDGAKNMSFCTKVCDALPCQNGAECTEKKTAFLCNCPPGVTGKTCGSIENEASLQKIELSVRFTSFNWSEQLSNESTTEHRKISHLIETSVREVFKSEASVVGIRVKRLRHGSIIADVELYMNSEKASIFAAQALQTAVADGSVGGLRVDRTYWHVKRFTCNGALGMENGQITDSQITAHPPFSNSESNRGRLNGKGWQSNIHNLITGYHLQISFNRSMNITGIATQGDGEESYVTFFTIAYSNDGDKWTMYKNFTGNIDVSSVAKTIFPHQLTLIKYIKIIPESWHRSMGMRIEVYGCTSTPVILPRDIPTTQQPNTKQPDVMGVGAKKDGYSWGKYLGISFGLLMVVGVLISFFVWWRNSKKKKQKEKTPLVLTRFKDGDYRVIEKNAEEYDDEDAV